MLAGLRAQSGLLLGNCTLGIGNSCPPSWVAAPTIGLFPSLHPVYRGCSIWGHIVPALGGQWQNMDDVNLPSPPVHSVRRASSVVDVLWSLLTCEAKMFSLCSHSHSSSTYLFLTPACSWPSNRWLSGPLSSHTKWWIQTLPKALPTGGMSSRYCLSGIPASGGSTFFSPFSAHIHILSCLDYKPNLTFFASASWSQGSSMPCGHTCE